MFPTMTSIRFENANVWIGDGTTANSITVEDGVIGIEGARVDETVDCCDGFLMPAFADGHAHPVFGGLEQQFAPIRHSTSVDEVVTAVRSWAAAHPDAQWVRGEGFNPALAPRGEFHAAWLDAAVPDRPVALRAMDYHTFWLNSAALRRVGYVPGVPQPHDGEIVLFPDGTPMGTLREWGAWRPVQDQFEPLSDGDAINALRYASSQYAAAGLVFVQDAWVEPEIVDAWLRALDADALQIDATLALWCDPAGWRDQLETFAETRELVSMRGAGRITAHTVKFFADGVIEAGTGALLEPYCDCPHSQGLANWDPDELALAVSAVDALGFDAHIHAIGDAAVRHALNAIESAISRNGARDRHPVIAHAQLIDPSDLPRFAALKTTANFEPLWACMDDDQERLSRPRLGAARADRQYQIASMIGSGANVSFGSDWPVTSHEPLLGIATAVTRQAHPELPPWMPHERITVEQALSAYTLGVARQLGRDDAGLLLAGFRGDLVLLDCDPRKVEPTSIGEIRVLGTWRAGRQTFGGPPS